MKTATVLTLILLASGMIPTISCLADEGIPIAAQTSDDPWSGGEGRAAIRSHHFDSGKGSLGGYVTSWFIHNWNSQPYYQSETGGLTLRHIILDFRDELEPGVGASIIIDSQNPTGIWREAAGVISPSRLFESDSFFLPVMRIGILKYPFGYRRMQQPNMLQRVDYSALDQEHSNSYSFEGGVSSWKTSYVDLDLALGQSFFQTLPPFSNNYYGPSANYAALESGNLFLHDSNRMVNIGASYSYSSIFGSPVRKVDFSAALSLAERMSFDAEMVSTLNGDGFESFNSTLDLKIEGPWKIGILGYMEPSGYVNSWSNWSLDSYREGLGLSWSATKNLDLKLQYDVDRSFPGYFQDLILQTQIGF